MQRKLLVRRHYSDVLMRLCESEKLNEMKVSQVIGASNMSRQTFYNYFDSLDDLICYSASRALTDVPHALFDPMNIVESYQFALQHRSFFTQLPSQPGYGSARDRQARWLRKHAYKRFVPEAMPGVERLHRVTQIDLFITGSTDVIFTWMASGCVPPIEIIAPAVIEMMPRFMLEAAGRSEPYELDPMDYPR